MTAARQCGSAAEPRANLPEGWTSFPSQPDSEGQAHWYATAPYDVSAIREPFDQWPDHPARRLCHTIVGKSWDELCSAATAQVELYEELTGGKQP
ncbi:hypothetical protein ACWD5Q_00585 [Streptomyces sp. NPDC002513]